MQVDVLECDRLLTKTLQVLLVKVKSGSRLHTVRLFAVLWIVQVTTGLVRVFVVLISLNQTLLHLVLFCLLESLEVSLA